MPASRHLAALPLAVLTLGLAACGSDEETTSIPASTDQSATTATAAATTTTSDTPYPAAVEKNFLDACKSSSNGNADACRCALAKIEETVSYEDFKAADVAIRGGGAASDETGAKINAAIQGCA